MISFSKLSRKLQAEQSSRDVKSRDQVSVSRPLETKFSWSRSRSRGSWSRSRQVWSRLETETSSKQWTSKKCRPNRQRPTSSKQQQGCCRCKFLIFNAYHC